MNYLIVFVQLGILVPINADYDLICPSAGQWRLRAQSYCPREEMYTCLKFIDPDMPDEQKYTETCKGPRKDSLGEKPVINSGNFDNVDCSEDRYQPILFSTTKGSNCLLLKSNCNEEGQFIYSNGSTKQDRTCGCNYVEQYVFLSQNLSNPCYCRPSVEDCTCYKKACDSGFRLSPDYNCVPDNETGERYNCKEIVTLEKDKVVNLTKSGLEEEHIQGKIFSGIIVYYRVRINNILNEKIRKVYIIRPLVNATWDEGAECKLQCKVSELNAYVEWFKNGVCIESSNNIAISCDNFLHTLTLNPVSIEDAGDYKLRLRNIKHTKASVTVKPLCVLKPLVNITCYEGDTCTLECEISLLNSPVYWSKDGTFIVGTDNVNKFSEGCLHTLTITHMSEADGGQYELHVSEKTITKAFVRFKSVSILGLDSQACIEGDTVRFTCEVSENGMAATWYKQDDELKHTNSVVIEQEGRIHRLLILNPLPSDSGDYSIQVKNVKQNATLLVKAFIKTHLVNTVIMEGLDVCLICEAEKAGFQPKWRKDGKEVQESNNIKLDDSKGVYKLSIVNVNLGHKGKYKIDANGYSSEAFLDVKEIPEVLKKMSKHDRDTFMEAAKAGTAPRYYIRIMIVGESGVGKTCLLRRLLNEEIDDVISTDGINIEVRKCKIDVETGVWHFTGAHGKTFTKWTKEEERWADCGFWDFAGQKEYYATHQTFLSSNAIYILAVDLSKNWAKTTSKKMVESEFITIGEYIEFWVDNIHCYVSDRNIASQGRNSHLNPPVMLVGTGTDKIKGPLREKIRTFENYLDELLGDTVKRHHLQNRLYVSNKFPSPDKSTFVQIRDIIFDLAQNMPKWGEHLPSRWILLEKQLLDLKKNVVSYDTVHSFAVDCTLPVEEDTSELDAFLRYEHEIGNIIFFDNIKEYIILDCEWLVDAFRCLVAPEQFHSRLINLTELKRSGKLSDEIIKELFKKIPKLRFLEHTPFLLKIMENFDVIVRSPFEMENTDNYYMPCMINATTFKNVCMQLRVEENQCKMTSWLCIDFTFLPPGFFNHVLVTYIKKYPLAMECETKPALYRGIGIFDLIKNGCKKIALCISSNTIAMQIWEWSSTSEQYYGELRRELLNIVNTIQQRYRIHIEYIVKLKCSKGHFYQSSGKKNPAEIMNCQEYYCNEHHEPHDSKAVYLSWFVQSEKDKDMNSNIDENREHKDTRFGERCTTCKQNPSVYWCYECQTSLCENCKSKHQKSEYHHIQHVQDKYTLDYTFKVNFDFIRDIKPVNDNLLCICEFLGNYLVTVDIKDSKQQYIPLHYTPHSITVVDNSTVAVTLYKKSEVLIVDIRQGHIIKHIDVKVECRGIMYSHNQLFVGCKDNTIKVVSMSGEITRTIPLSFRPYYICGSDDGSIYCADVSKLYCIDTEGKLLFTFSHPDMGSPRSIITDDRGHVLVVCNKSENIVSVSPDGKQCQVIVKHIPSKVFSQCYIPQTKSLVVGRDKIIDVYKLCNVD